jgi:hypothetical protein
VLRREERKGAKSMRVYATGTAAAAAPTPGSRRAQSGTFALTENDSPRAARQAAAPRAVATLDALMALQGFDDPSERRRRAIKRGRTLLDALDDLKLGVLAGSLDAPALGRLRELAEGLGEQTGDPRLDAIMAEIDLRAAVELAKLSRR